MDLNDAVEQAITECIQEGILAEFLQQNRAEVYKVSIFEYDKEKEEKKLRKAEYEHGLEEGLTIGKQAGREEGITIGKEAGREEGITIGKAAGRQEGENLMGHLMQLLMEKGRFEDITRASSDSEARQKLYEEFHLV